MNLQMHVIAPKAAAFNQHRAAQYFSYHQEVIQITDK